VATFSIVARAKLTTAPWFQGTIERMSTADMPRTRLEALLRELEARRQLNGSECCMSYEQQLRTCHQLAQGVLLFHGSSSVDLLQKIVQAGALLSRAKLGQDPFDTQAYLGLTDWVYTSAGLLHPDRPVALVFGPEAEEQEQRVEASPWDTGAFCKSLCPSLPAMPGNPERRDRFRDHTLPSPEWREYMAHYVASCFGSLQDYLKGRPHRWSDPLGALGPNRLSRVFEVRFHERLPLKISTVKAIFVPRLVGDRKFLSLRKALNELSRQRVHVEYYDGAEMLLREKLDRWMPEVS
jgi:hypothetical protein